LGRFPVINKGVDELEDIFIEEDPDDWIIDADGFYVATRSFLIRRGYCCANQCRNCPYINWRNSQTWEPLPAKAVHFTKVSPKAVEGARKALTYHEQQVQTGKQTKEEHHQAMIAHYHLLLERWEEL
jgi:hypothetical protein